METVRRLLGRSAAENETLRDVASSLLHLAEVAKGSGQPTRAILEAQITIIRLKVDFVLGGA